MDAKFKIGDEVRVTEETVKDEDFHSGLEADMLSDRYSQREINLVFGRIIKRQKLIIISVESHFDEYAYSTKPTVGCAIDENKIELFI